MRANSKVTYSIIGFIPIDMIDDAIWEFFMV